MPALISHKAKKVFFLRNHDVLADILGHSNFDGEDWAVGDLVVFENGTVAYVEAFPEGGHGYSEPANGELRSIVEEIRSYGDSRLEVASEVQTWEQLFQRLSQPLPIEMNWWHRMLR